MTKDIAFGIIISLLFVSLVVLFCVILIKLYINKIKKYNQIIFEKELNYQKELNQSIIESQEQTLYNISQELHDDAGQQLTYINFQLENLKLDSEENEVMLKPVSKSLVQLAHTIRNLSHSLNNQILSNENLIKAIETEVKRIGNTSHLKFEFSSLHKNTKLFSANEKIVLYRIFQEVINNILKYAKAKNVLVKIENQPNFKIIISDDGIGFNLEEKRNNQKTNGLQNIYSRAKLIHYQIDITSKENIGTTVIISEATT